MTHKSEPELQELVKARFSDAPTVNKNCEDFGLVHSMLSRGSCREFAETSIPPVTLDVLCAAALASPTKSDLQQRDIILLQSPEQRERLSMLVTGQAWVRQAPMLAVFCGNNRRQRLLHDWHGIPFARQLLGLKITETPPAFS